MPALWIRGADTLGHVRAKVPELALPHLDALGFSRLYGGGQPALGQYGRARELSMGKDTTTAEDAATGPSFWKSIFGGRPHTD